MHSMTLRSLSSAACAVSLVALSILGLGCGGDSPPASASATIGASGGALVGPAGSGVVVPAGAVDSDTTISVTQIPRSTPPAGTALVAEPIRLGPEGKTFSKPVEVSITVPSTQLPPGGSMANVVVMRAPAGTQNYVPLPTRAMGDKAVAVTEHFSDFIAVVASGDGGLPFGACGDTQCDTSATANESCSSCPLDCGLCFSGGIDVCYDGLCNGSETNASCPFDCPPPPLRDCAINNGGCDPLAVCAKNGTSVTCTCPAVTIDQLGDGTLCTTSGNCYAEACYTGTCVDYATNHYCSCSPGYGGPTCSTITDCSLFNGGCDVNATCSTNTGSVVCTCNSGYVGDGIYCTPTTGGVCGDGYPDAGETCDDGDTQSGDGCDSSCQLENGWACPMPGLACFAICGDGLVLGAETCDDLNVADGDGCSTACLDEYGFTCPAFGGSCTSTCGDGFRASVEACDDGNTYAEDGCAGDCSFVESGFNCPSPGGLCTVAACDAASDADTGTANFVLTSFALQTNGLNLDGIDDSSTISGAGCNYGDSSGGIDNAYWNVAQAAIGEVDLVSETAAFFAAQTSVQIALEHWNQTSDDGCVGVTITFDSPTLGTISSHGSGSIVADQVHIDMVTVLPMTPTFTTGTTVACGGACTPATMPLTLFAPVLDFSMDSGHTSVLTGVLGGAFYVDDTTLGFDTLNPLGISAQLDVYAANAMVTQASLAALQSAFSLNRDTHLNADGSRGICGGTFQANAVSVGYTFSSL